MICKPVAAFGYVVFLASLVDGEVHTVNITSRDGAYTNGYYYYYEGLAKFHSVDTNTDLPDRTIGWLNKEHSDAGTAAPGTVSITAVGDTSWVCIPLTHNVSLPPSLTSLTLSSSDTGTFAQGSDLFLVKGSVTVAGRVFVGPAQIRVRSGDVQYTPTEPSHLLKF
jgi:hypothetical protein